MRKDREDWVTVKQAADRLGVARDTVYRLLADKKIPGHRIGWKWRVLVSDLAMLLHERDAEQSTGDGAMVFRVGDRVEKYTGGYTTFGEVRGVVTTKAGEVRVVVELEPQGGMLMIYNEGQLRLV